jgi:steroid delta-isomerase-like uncharacterized protein
MEYTAISAFMNRFVTFINTAAPDLALELISPNAIFYVPGSNEPLSGPQGYLDIIGMMRSGFPDVQWSLEETIIEGDRVAARFIMRGTHSLTFNGIPPSGRCVEMQAMNFYRLQSGQIIEERGQPDLLSLMQQIGAIPH